MKGEKGEIIGGRYQIKKTLGKGGFGRVYLAKQISFNRDVVIKTILPSMRNDEILKERFFREANLICTITHPNIITYYDFGMDEDKDLYLVMEYLKGLTLKEIIAHQSLLPFHRIVNIISQICDGLNEIHSKGIVHRDIKPSNIFIIRNEDKSDFVKIIDFGIVGINKEFLGKNEEFEQIKNITKNEYIVGTPEYIAPEGIKGEEIDGRFDIYSLGVLCYELLCGRRPFISESRMDILLKHLREVPPSPSSIHHGRYIPFSLEKVILKSLSKSPQMRQENVIEFKEGFLKAVSLLTPTGFFEKTSSMDIALFSEGKTSVTIEEKKEKKRFLKILLLLLFPFILIGGIFLFLFEKKEENYLKNSIRNGVSSLFFLERRGSLKNFIQKSEIKKKTQPFEKNKKQKQGSAKMNLNAIPWAFVYIDGKLKGKTPILIEKIPSGIHKIEFKHPRFRVKKIRVNLKKGENKKYNVNMRK